MIYSFRLNRQTDSTERQRERERSGVGGEIWLNKEEMKRTQSIWTTSKTESCYFQRSYYFRAFKRICKSPKSVRRAWTFNVALQHNRSRTRANTLICQWLFTQHQCLFTERQPLHPIGEGVTHSGRKEKENYRPLLSHFPCPGLLTGKSFSHSGNLFALKESDASVLSFFLCFLSFTFFYFFKFIFVVVALTQDWLGIKRSFPKAKMNEREIQN